MAQSVDLKAGLSGVHTEVFIFSLHFQTWSLWGLQVGPRTTASQTHCLCNHLTFFGSTFLVMPNAIDVHQTAELFATFEDNPVVVSTVACLCMVYMLVVIWARRKDIQDQSKVRCWVPGNGSNRDCRGQSPGVTAALNSWGHLRHAGPLA